MDPQLVHNMFYLAIPILEKILRPILVYAFLIVGLRLAGKRELAQLNPFDLVVLLTLSNTVQNAIIGNDTTVTGGLIGASTLLIANYLVVRFVYRHGAIEKLMEGDEDVLIEKGQVRTKALEEEAITLVELQEAAHKQGFASLDAVESAILEPSGSIAFIAKTPEPEMVRHQELVARLDQLARELAELRASSKPGVSA